MDKLILKMLTQILINQQQLMVNTSIINPNPETTKDIAEAYENTNELLQEIMKHPRNRDVSSKRPKRRRKTIRKSKLANENFI
jgi:hypothetical protein